MTQTADSGPVDPRALSVEQMAKLLSAAGGRAVSVQEVQADLASGAPVGPNGRINLVAYTAWLLRQVQHPQGQGHGD